MRETTKRFLCIALSLAMVLIAIPSAVFATKSRQKIITGQN